MVGPSGVQVLEYNARFGDPESQVVLPRLRTDLIELLDASARGRLGGASAEWSDQPSVGVVMASRGYPGAFTTGFPIDGFGAIDPGVVAFHAATASDPSGDGTTGWRVLTQA